MTIIARTPSSSIPIADEQEVTRLEAPSAEQFHEEFVRRAKPVVLTGVANRWPAFERWGPDYLKQVAGDAKVTVHYDESGDFCRWYSPDTQGNREMRLGEFIDILMSEPQDRRFYMTEHDMARISKKLLGEIDMSPYPFIKDREIGPCMFLGRDTMMPLHYHCWTEAVCAQIIGEKEFVLFPPEDTSRMYPFPWWTDFFHFSKVDAGSQASVFTDSSHLSYDKHGTGRFPLYGKASPIRVPLHAGDILFIPVHWWHVTTCPGFQLNVVWFWPSSWRRWRFPAPGLQTMGRLSWLRLRNGFRRVKGVYPR